MILEKDRKWCWPMLDSAVRVQPRSVAFFDVDETLITVKSMREFLRYHFACYGEPEDRFDVAWQALVDIAAATGSRTASNRAYYRNFAGRLVDVVTAHGRDWFDKAHRSADFLHRPVVEAFRRHVSDGAYTVLVSGSFAPCFHPIAEFLGADEVLCSQPAAVDGRYTGDVTVTMIGSEKANAATRLIAEQGVAATRCHAYGDHSSDLELLTVVGHPVVIGDDPVLSTIATERGWRRLPGITGVSKRP
jgi:HAD superfamily hydrolase (TIGR01490 family)